MMSKLFSSSTCRACKILPLTRYSAAAAAAAKPPFIAEYLVSHLGFTVHKAAEASKRLRRIKSPHQPNSVLDFFRSYGFAESQIKKLISSRPRCLSLDVNKNLTPKFRSLQDIGFSGSNLTHLILSNASVLELNFHRSILPKIQFWTSLLGSNAVFLRTLKRNQRFLGDKIENKVLPNLSLLRGCGVSDHRIAMIVQTHPRFILQPVDSLRANIEQVEGMGIPRSSGMFLRVLSALFMISPKNLKAKMELMREYGWSEADFLKAFGKAPPFTRITKKLIREKMKFLLKVAGCEPGYVALHPELLMYSLDKRMIPRHQVLQLLKTRGFYSGKCGVNSVMSMSVSRFKERYVLKYKEEVPELYDLYVSGCDKRET